MEYHLRYLKRIELILARKSGAYTRYFITQNIGKEEKQALSILRKKTSLHIALILSMRHVRTRTQLCEELEKSASTVSYHLNKLIEVDIVQRYYDNNKVKYTLWDEATIDKLLIKHKEGLLDDFVVAFYEALNPAGKNTWIRSMLKLLKKNDEFISEIFSEMFPHPYWG
ncbi:MAG: winged helix-turn-helix transcriptional regulator [Thermoplasmatales archaeon]|nr:winged helix-turn-helix transcriptional regulator [Thermoplasmatales archaeon]